MDEEAQMRKRIYGKGIVEHREFPVHDLGDGGFSTPNPNTIIRDAELALYDDHGRRKHPLDLRNPEDRMSNRHISTQILYLVGLRRVHRDSPQACANIDKQITKLEKQYK